MKKINVFLCLVFFLMFICMTEVGAATYSKEFIDPNSNKLIYKLSISSDGLSDELVMNANIYDGFTYVKDDYKFYSNYLYSYEFIDNGDKLVSIGGKTAEVLIQMDGLVEGNKYDVYYIDSVSVFDEDLGYNVTNYTLDDTLNGIEATVVKINDKLYIKFITSSLKSFALSQHMSKTYQDKLNKVTNNGVFTLNAVDAKKYDKFDVYAYFSVLNRNNEEYEINPVGSYIGDELYMTLVFSDLPNEKHLVRYKYKYNVINPKIKKSLDEIMDGLTDVNSGSSVISKWFVIEDLSYINYLYNINNIDTEMIYYSNELRKVFKGLNFIPYFDFRMGDSTSFVTESAGIITISYNGILYPLGIDGGYKLKQVIYVSSDTENNDEALMQAVKDRIIKYLGIDKSNISLTVAGTRQSLVDEVGLDVWQNYNEDFLSDNYYNLVINGKKVQIVIERNSEKAIELEFKTKDLLTDVEVNTFSGVIPLDTQISVDEIATDSSEYKDMLKKLGKETGLMFDLKLFSLSLDKYVKKLDNGTFKVRIPLTESYKGKKLSAYYLADDGKIEEYDISINKNMAEFVTSHFSKYTIAESETIISFDNPKTGDGIIIFVLSGCISLLGLLVMGLCIKKRIIV